MSMTGEPVNALQGETLLVADDNTINLHFFKSVLVKKGAQVIPVANGNAAVEALRQRCMSLVLLDLQMPGRSGLEVIRLMRRDKALEHTATPVIAISAHLTSSQIGDVLDAGADACLIKPVSSQDLIQQCTHCLAGIDRPTALHSDTESNSQLVWDQRRASDITGGDREVLSQMLTLFLDQLPRQHRAVNHAIRARDYQSAREKAHRLHGSARFCATPALEMAAANLQQSLESGQIETIHTALGEFNRRVEQLQQYADEQLKPRFVRTPTLR